MPRPIWKGHISFGLVGVEDSSDQAKQPQLGNGDNDATKPVPVEVVESLSANEIAQGILGPLISPLASIAMVVVLLIFMLLKREDLRNRFIYLIGGGHLYLTTQALTDAAAHVGAMSTF